MSGPREPSAADPGGPLVLCPGCGAATVYRLDNRWRPFCSERCKQRDFGAWASEHYRVGAAAPAESDDEQAAPPAH